MKLLFICKRRPQQRDLIERPYGRFWHLPQLLAARGHAVHLALLDHRKSECITFVRDNLTVSSRDARREGIHRVRQDLLETARSNEPDWIIGCSDTWYGWLAHWLSRKTGARLAIDAYDNYEAYMPWNLPLHWQWHRALHAADLVTAAGPQLAQLLDRQRRGRSPTVIVPMAADPVFRPHDRDTARRALGLPERVPLVGYCGSWANNRGTDVLLTAFRLIRARMPEACLVLTGNPPPHARAEPGIIATGYVKDAQLPRVLSALNVACVITADTSFGRYSYPAKLCEAMACQVPVVATATGPVRWMLQNDDRYLVPIDDDAALAERVLDRLDGAAANYPDLPSWEASAASLEPALLSAEHGVKT